MPLTRSGLDPVAELGRRREQEPVSRLDLFGNTVWLVTRHAEVRAVLGDTTTFSNDFANLLAAGGDDAEELGLADPGGLGFRDPPEHTRLRRLLAPSFSARRLEALLPRIRAVVESRLDALEAAGSPADLVEQFATAVPSMVIGEFLGVPEAEQMEFGKLAAGRFDLLESILSPLDSAASSLDYLLGLIEPQRATLVRAEGTDVDAVVEELLRYLTVVQVAFPRFARADTTIAGQAVAAGDLVLCSLSSADRDAALGEGMERLDLSRRSTPHLAFAYGIHHCLGAQLARLELRVAFPALLRRFPTLRLAVEPGEIRYRERSIVYGVDEL